MHGLQLFQARVGFLLHMHQIQPVCVVLNLYPELLSRDNDVV